MINDRLFTTITDFFTDLCGAHRRETKITEDFRKVDDLLPALTSSYAFGVTKPQGNYTTKWSNLHENHELDARETHHRLNVFYEEDILRFIQNGFDGFRTG